MTGASENQLTNKKIEVDCEKSYIQILFTTCAVKKRIYN